MTAVAIYYLENGVHCLWPTSQLGGVGNLVFRLHIGYIMLLRNWSPTSQLGGVDVHVYTNTTMSVLTYLSPTMQGHCRTCGVLIGPPPALLPMLPPPGTGERETGTQEQPGGRHRQEQPGDKAIFGS